MSYTARPMRCCICSQGTDGTHRVRLRHEARWGRKGEIRYVVYNLPAAKQECDVSVIAVTCRCMSVLTWWTGRIVLRRLQARLIIMTGTGYPQTTNQLNFHTHRGQSRQITVVLSRLARDTLFTVIT